MDKQAVTSVPILEAIAGRWSVRAYDPERPVEKEKLVAIMEAARWAASSRNKQPWRFLVATRQDDPDGYARLLNCLKSSNQSWAKFAPVLIMGIAEGTGHKSGPYRPWYDTGQAVANLAIQATALGLHLCQIGGFVRETARQTFQIPENYEPVVCIALGYRAEPIPAERYDSEARPRHRKPLSEVVFAASETWGSGSFLLDE